MARRNNRGQKSQKNYVLRNLLLIICLVVLVVGAITYFQKENGADVTLGDKLSQKVESVTESVKQAVSDVADSIGAEELFGKENSIPAANHSSSRNINVSDCDLGYEEDNPLYFGNPSDAYFNVSFDENYLMEKENYTMSYNNSTLCANWVAWHLDIDDMGDAHRSNKFVADKDLPEEWYHVTKDDYNFNDYGFDRGHLCPSADRTSKADANKETFLMSNMVPQSSDNNRIVWVALEKYQREIVEAGNELYIFAGPAGTGGEGDKGYFEYIPVKADDGSELRINVPAYTWKIILAVPEGNDDINRINEDAEVIAVCVPNKKGINSDLSWKKYLCSIDDIEGLTGFDFLETLEDNLEESIESRGASN